MTIYLRNDPSELSFVASSIGYLLAVPSLFDRKRPRGFLLPAYLPSTKAGSFYERSIEAEASSPPFPTWIDLVTGENRCCRLFDRLVESSARMPYMSIYVRTLVVVQAARLMVFNASKSKRGHCRQGH